MLLLLLFRKVVAKPHDGATAVRSWVWAAGVCTGPESGAAVLVRDHGGLALALRKHLLRLHRLVRTTAILGG